MIGLGWRRIRREPGPTIFETAITGVTPKGARIRSHGVSVGGLSLVGHVELDIDVHDVDQLAQERLRQREPYAWLRLTPRQLRARTTKIRHEILGEKITAVAEALRAAYPDVRPLLTRTPRGGRATIILDRLIDPPLARELGRSVLDRIYVEGVSLEVFPTAKGRTARLPLTRSRLVDDHGRTMHSRRAQDAAWLAEHARELLTPLRAFDVTVRDLKRWARAAAMPRSEAELSTRVESPKVEREDRIGDRQQFAGEFAATVRAYLETGIADDESWIASGKIAFAARVGLGLELPQCRALLDHVIERTPAEGATRANRYGGLELRISYDCVLRYYDQGIAAGRLRPGLLADPGLRELAGRILGVDLTRRAPRTEDAEARRDRISHARSAAARRRWESARATSSVAA